MPEFTPEQMSLEHLAQSCLEEAGAALETNEGLLFDAIMTAESMEEAMDAVLGLYPRLSIDPLADILERGLLMASLFGHYTAEQELPDAEADDPEVEDGGI